MGEPLSAQRLLGKRIHGGVTVGIGPEERIVSTGHGADRQVSDPETGEPRDGRRPAAVDRETLNKAVGAEIAAMRKVKRMKQRPVWRQRFRRMGR